MSLPLPHAMALASDDLPDWSAAEDLLHEAQHQSESAHEQPFDPPSPRTQTDLSDAVPRLAFMDQPSDELYRPILDSPDLAYKLYPINLRPLPGAQDEPTGLIQDTRFRPADRYANDHPTWVPDYPESHPTSLVDYDVLAQWLAQHLPATEQLDALVIFTESRSLEVHQKALATPIQPTRASP